jgi:ketosteroid isomerase-like protein
MRTRIFSTLLLCLLGCFVIRALPQEKPDVASIRALELKWVDAYKKKLPTLRLCWQTTTSSHWKTAALRQVGFISYNAGPLRVDIAELTDVKIHVHENVAVVVARYHERGELGGKSYDYHDRLTDVWMKIGGKWQLIASHYSLPVSL